MGFRYWEGAVEVRGTSAGRPVTGRGYVELTGYAGSAPPTRRTLTPIHRTKARNPYVRTPRGTDR